MVDLRKLTGRTSTSADPAAWALSCNGCAVMAWSLSLPFSRLADRILEFAPTTGGKDMGEGSLVDGAIKFLQK